MSCVSRQIRIRGDLIVSFFFSSTGKFAFFKAIVTGDPKPTVTWSRNNGDVSDTSRYQTKYDPNSDEHTFEASDIGYQITTAGRCKRAIQIAMRKIDN